MEIYAYLNFFLELRIGGMIPSTTWKSLQSAGFLDLSSNYVQLTRSRKLDFHQSARSLPLILVLQGEFQIQWPSLMLGKFKKSRPTLNLANNSIVGPIPESFGQLSTLRELQIYDNKLNGTLSELHFANLTELSWFRVGGNQLTLEVKHDWIPPFQLVALGLHSCYIGSRFPLWLNSQRHLQFLDLVNSRISDIFPIRFLKSASQLKILDLEQNQIHGEMPNLTEFTQLLFLSMDSNNMSGPLPLISSNLVYFGLSYNSFSGSISHFLCDKINETKRLEALKLNDNYLQGELPDCWMSYQNLKILKLSNNKLTGNLPNSFGSLASLVWLDLGKNRLSGTIPVSLKNCTALESLDVGENEFVGNIPAWFGERFSRM
ncbi:hypothetical protein CUMW_140100, partial [Citrus unshiu]